MCADKNQKTLIEVNDSLSKDLKSVTLVLIKNINLMVKRISQIESNRTYTCSKSFLEDVNAILDSYETVSVLLTDAINEILFKNRESVLKKYKKLFNSRKNIVVRAESSSEFIKESVYVSSLSCRYNFLYDFISDHLVKIDRILNSDKKQSRKQFVELKELLLELFSLSIYDNGLKRLVNDIISYRVQEIDKKFVLTLK